MVVVKLLILRKALEVVFSIDLYSKIANWNTYVLDFLGYAKPKYLLKLYNGLKIVLRGKTADKWPIHEILIRDDYKLQSLNVKPKIIIDLGANIGIFSLISALKYPNAKIYAIEPGRNNFSLLKENIGLNKLQRKIIPINVACSAKSEKITFYNEDPYNWPRPMRRKRRYLVRAKSLPDIFKSYNIKHCDLLKIDIEGEEYEVIYSLDKNFFSKIGRIHLEYHNLDRKKRNKRYLLDYLAKIGYRVTERKFLDKNIGLIYASRFKTID